jgi:hypothetical protein
MRRQRSAHAEGTETPARNGVRGANEIVSVRSANRGDHGGAVCRQANEPIGQTKEIDVLKITRTETPVEEKWILQGRLVGLWVSELRRIWKRTHRADDNLKCIVDLNEVTSIDKTGERLLQTMSKQGAQFIATGVYIKYVLQQRCAR